MAKQELVIMTAKIYVKAYAMYCKRNGLEVVKWCMMSEYKKCDILDEIEDILMSDSQNASDYHNQWIAKREENNLPPCQNNVKQAPFFELSEHEQYRQGLLFSLTKLIS